jgi:hypothetical protein
MGRSDGVEIDSPGTVDGDLDTPSGDLGIYELQVECREKWREHAG